MDNNLNQQPMQEIKKKKTWIVPVIIGVALLIVGAGVAALVYYNSVAKPKKELQRQLDLGDKYLTDMDYENALLAYKAAIEIDPKCEEAYLGIVKIEDKLVEMVEKGEASDKIRDLLDDASLLLDKGYSQTDSTTLKKKIKKVIEQKEQVISLNAGAETEGDYSDAYRAYYDYLKVCDVNNSDEGSYMKDKRLVAFSDIYGDKQPEMVFLSFEMVEDIYSTYPKFELTGVTYENGQIKVVLPGMICDAPVQGSSTYLLFKADDSKILYGICEWSEFRESEGTDIIRFSEQNGVLAQEVLFKRYFECDANWDDFESDVWTKSFTKGGENLSEQNFKRQVNEFLSNMTEIVYLGSSFPENGDYYINPSARNISMTYDDAFTYLQGQIN